MKARTEDDILSRAPIKAKLGDQEYSIPLLAVMAQREWRKKLFAELGPILESFKPKSEGNGMVDGLAASLLNFPEKLCELVFLYREYGFALASLADVPDEEVHVEFIALIAKNPLAEAPDFPRGAILAKSTEEQIASAFSGLQNCSQTIGSRRYAALRS